MYTSRAPVTGLFSPAVRAKGPIANGRIGRVLV